MAKNSEKVAKTTNQNAPTEAVIIQNVLSENGTEQQTADGQNEAPKERKTRETKEQRVERERLEIAQEKAEKAAEVERCKPLLAEYRKTLIAGACKLEKTNDTIVPATLSKMLIPAAQVDKIKEQQSENLSKLVYWGFVKNGIRIATIADITAVELVNSNAEFTAADEAIANAKAAKADLFNPEHYSK